MRTSRGLLPLAAALSLTGCGVNLFQPRAEVLSKMALPDGMVISAPSGWCIDQSTTSAGAATSVVVLGSCAALSGDAEQLQPDVPGVVTISIEAQAGALLDSETLQTFFLSDAGRATLARNGDPESVSILDTRQEDGLLYLHASDDSLGPDASKEIWRALFGLSGRFVAVSFYSRSEDEIAPEDGLSTLTAQVEELRAANQI
ncbi:MAG: hypothetical protein AAF718_16485 [Pseudomonadota bacterium]